MSSKYDADDVLSRVEDFEFGPRGQKKFYRASCGAVDAEGTQAARRYEAVVRIGELIQAWTAISNRSLKNIYRQVMDEVLDEYEFAKAHEPILRDMLVLYWKRGAELQAALTEKPKPQVRKAGLPAELNEAWRDAGQMQAGIPDDTAYPERREMDATLYNPSREAGPF